MRGRIDRSNPADLSILYMINELIPLFAQRLFGNCRAEKAVGIGPTKLIPEDPAQLIYLERVKIGRPAEIIESYDKWNYIKCSSRAII